MKKILLSTVLAASSWALFAQDTTNRTNSNTTTNQQANTSTNQQMNTSTNQNTSNQMTNTATTTSTYNAYAVPNYVQTNFQAQHPNVSNLAWDRSTADWYHGYYTDANGRYTHVYYSTDPYYNVKYYPERVTGYIVSLPVLQTFVPDAVITTALNQYKQNLYDITGMKGNNNTDMYVVRVMDNGELKSMWMDANGTALTDYWRIEEQPVTTDVNASMSTDSNAAMNQNASTDNSSTNTNSSMNTDMNQTNTDAKTKTKTKMSDGTETKTKTKNGQTKTKTSASPTTPNDQF
jgi:hypothetical protein